MSLNTVTFKIVILCSFFYLLHGYMLNGKPFSRQSKEMLMDEASLIASKLLSPSLSKGYEAGSFRWENCAPNTAALQIHSFEMSPQPVIAPGNMTIKVSSSLNKDIVEPLKMVSTLQIKQSMFYITLPCIASMGSCVFRDLCPTLQAMAASCPYSITKEDLTCSCPLKRGKYNMDNLVFPVLEPVPDGEYRAKLKFFHDDEVLGCLQFDFKVKHKY